MDRQVLLGAGTHGFSSQQTSEDTWEGREEPVDISPVNTFRVIVQKL